MIGAFRRRGAVLVLAVSAAGAGLAGCGPSRDRPDGAGSGGGEVGAPPPAARPKVLLIGIDGIRPDVLARVPTPNLDALAARGAFTARARTGYPTMSGPGWSSFLIGVWPEKHGVTDNEFQGSRYDRYPDLFTRIESVRPELNTFVVADWLPLVTTDHNGPVVSDAVDVKHVLDGYELGWAEADERSVELAEEALRTGDPDAMFVYLGNPDETSHQAESIGEEYRSAIALADSLVGRLVAAVEARPTRAREDWLILVSTDHGRRTDGGHGGDTPEERTTFFIASGPSVTRPAPDSTFIVDVAVTALAHLGIPLDPAWELDGKVVGLERPNILLVFTDDHAAHAVGAYGSVINETPNIDRLAAEGMLFRNSFVTNSICAPSRATVLTGQFGHLNGVPTNRDTLRAGAVTFPALLQAAGYQTAIIGKWHLKVAPEGFDHYEVLRGQGRYYNPVMFLPGGDSAVYEGYTTDVITDRALAWLAEGRDASRPFLLMYQHKAPHRRWDPGPDHLELYADRDIPEPATLFDDHEGRTSAARTQEMEIGRDLDARDLKLEPPPGLTDAQLARWNAAYGPRNEAFARAAPEGDDLVRWKYQRYIKDYLRTIASVDDNLGRVLDFLDERGLAENTVVVYTSDQGFFLGDHGWFDKRWMYEESLRTPLLIRWPAVVAPGSVNDDLVQNLDLAETFLEVAGVPVPEEMQGRSLVPLLRGERPEDWRDAIYYQYFEYPGWHMVRRHYGVRTRTHKLIHYYEIGEWELFDLTRDPDELRSVYGDPAYAEVQAELARRLEELRVRYGVPEEDPVPYVSWPPSE